MASVTTEELDKKKSNTRKKCAVTPLQDDHTGYIKTRTFHMYTENLLFLI
jgi:hypothetical protein